MQACTVEKYLISPHALTRQGGCPRDEDVGHVTKHLQAQCWPLGGQLPALEHLTIGCGSEEGRKAGRHLRQSQ